MTSKKLVSGKHPLTVRIDEEVYRELRIVAAYENLSVNELLANIAATFVQSRLANMEEVRKE